MVGVVHNPLRDDWYTAVAGQGAWHNSEAIRVGQQHGLDQSVIGVGFFYDRGAMMEATLAAIKDCFHAQIHGIRRLGTASLDLCYVAAGNFAGFFEFELAPWDFAAGRLIVTEAGGRVTDCQGGELQLHKSSVLATNTHLHEALLAVTRKHLPRSN